MATARIAHDVQAQRELLRARFVSTVLELPLPTLYELSRKDPTRFGVVRLGRSVRFRRVAIDKIVAGEG